ncbi:MAG: four helix bundle protein [Chitinophagales bacterium]|nr:four helix bundle protein [Chitinophagales bacterium]
MDKHDLQERTKQFALDIIKLCNMLPKETAFFVFARQIIRSSSSVGANYRAACRAKSNADFINKLKIVEEETDETMFFLELLKELHPSGEKPIVSLIKEAKELLAIFVASIKTTRANSSFYSESKS